MPEEDYADELKESIKAELLPLPEERVSKKKKYILSKKQIEYLSYAFDLMYDEIINDIKTLFIVEMEDYGDFIQYAYEGLDFLIMYELKFDGFDESPQGEMMGIGSFSTKEWFKLYNKPRNHHPFFWDMNERLSFPANREITVYYAIIP